MSGVPDRRGTGFVRSAESRYCAFPAGIAASTPLTSVVWRALTSRPCGQPIRRAQQAKDLSPWVRSVYCCVGIEFLRSTIASDLARLAWVAARSRIAAWSGLGANASAAHNSDYGHCQNSRLQ